jgi:hypothetical protein
MGNMRSPILEQAFTQRLRFELELGLGLSETVALNREAMFEICNSAGDSGEGGSLCLLAWVADAVLSLLG